MLQPKAVPMARVVPGEATSVQINTSLINKKATQDPSLKQTVASCKVLLLGVFCRPTTCINLPGGRMRVRARSR